MLSTAGSLTTIIDERDTLLNSDFSSPNYFEDVLGVILMGWNEPPGGNEDKDPWGHRGNNEGPPDLDEIVRKMQQGIGGIIRKMQQGIGGIFGKKPSNIGRGERLNVNIPIRRNTMIAEEDTTRIRKFLLLLFALAVTAILVMWCVGINDNGYRTVIQWPTGKTYVKFTPGFYFTAFGTAITYKDAGTYAFGHVTEEGDRNASLTTPPIPVTYNDGGKGDVSGIVRWDLPADEESMLQLHRKYRSPEGVAHNLVAQTVQESMNLTAALMSSEEAYAEKREVYRTWARIQTEEGSFATQQETKCEKTAAGTTECREIASIRRGDDGKIIHSSVSPLKGYFVKTPQFQVKEWDFETNTLTQISKKREATMAIITAKADAERAKQEAITAEEEGKAKVMTAKYEKEVEKIKEVVTAEKVAAVAVIDAEKKVALAAQLKLEKEQDKFAAAHEKQAAILRGEGEAEARRLKMAADNALEQKLATYEKVSGMYAKAIAQQKWVPEVQFGGDAGTGGTGSGAQALIDLFTAKTAKDIALDMNLGTVRSDR